MLNTSGIKHAIGIIIFCLFSSCESHNSKLPNLDIQGHRGFRGNMPENTIRGMIEALKTGVGTLEFDVVISSDNKVLLSHEPFMNKDICLDSLGNKILDEESFNIYKLSYNEIKKFDCGKNGNSRFPDQARISSCKPLLYDLIDSLKMYCLNQNIAFPYLNIEIKSRLTWENKYHPNYKEYVNLVIKVLDSAEIRNKAIIQSFDARVLKYTHSEYEDIRLAYLSETPSDWQEEIAELGFSPDIYSPYYQYLSLIMVRNIQDQNMQIIPWTINEIDDIKSIINMGVDGIITDYPDCAMIIKNEMIIEN